MHEKSTPVNIKYIFHAFNLKHSKIILFFLVNFVPSWWKKSL